MAQIANLVLNDGSATPVAKTFVPQVPQVGETPALWYNKDSSFPIGYKRVTLSVIVKSEGVSKVTVKVMDPTLVEVAGVRSVAYHESATITFTLPAQSSEQNRKDILAYAKNLLGNTLMTDAVVNLQPAY